MGIGDHIGEPVDSHGNYPDGTPAAPSYPEQQQIDASATADGTVLRPNGTIDDAATAAKQKADAQAAAAARAQAAAAAAAQANYLGHYQYGGYANGANDASNRYRQEGEAAQGRAAPQIDYGVANDDHNRNVITSQNQNQLAGLLAARANGSMPSIAGMRANQDINRALADQSSVAASARGPAALALAQQNQANNSASAMSNISNSAQVNTAQEQLNNTVAAQQAYTGIRQGDQALQSQDAAQATAQGELNAQKQNANDAYQLGMTGYETGVQTTNLQAQGSQIAGERGAYVNQQGLDLAHDQNSTAKTTPWITGALGGAAAVGGAVVGSILGGSAAPGGAQGGVAGGYGAGGTTAGTGGGAPGGVNAGNGSYDPSTGAPVSGEGGGYNPDGSNPWDPTSDDRAKAPASLSTTTTDTTGPAASSVSMARMLAARDAETERQKKAKEYGGLVSGVVNGLGQAFAQQPQPRPFTPAQPQMQNITFSDDKTKLAAAWDQGHAAGVAKETMRASDAHAAELKAARGPAPQTGGDAPRQFRGEGALAAVTDHPWTQPGPLAEALGANENRSVLDAAGEHFRGPQGPQQPGAPIARVAPPTGSFDAQVRDQFGSPPPVVLQPTQASAQPDYFNLPQQVATTSDDTAKSGMSLSGAVGRRQVGTLGKEVSASDTADFARSLRSTPYTYKDEYASREGQAPGEVNVGPVAQDVERSKIGATIVKPDPNGSGMRTLDETKMVKGLGAIAASHQDKLDEHERTLSLMARRLGGAR